MAKLLPTERSVTFTGRAGSRVLRLLGLDDADKRLLELDRAAEHGQYSDEPSGAWLDALGELAKLPARSLEGIAAKVKWALRERGQGETVHCERLATGLLQDLAKLTGGTVPKVDTAPEEDAHG